MSQKSMFYDHHVEGFLRRHGYGEGIDRHAAELERRRLETDAVSEFNKTGATAPEMERHRAAAQEAAEHRASPFKGAPGREHWVRRSHGARSEDH